MMKDYKKILRTVGTHARIMFSGFKRTLFGAATTGLFAIAFYGLYAIPSEDGYAAVSDFITSLATLVLAFTCMYVQGTFRKTKGERRGVAK